MFKARVFYLHLSVKLVPVGYGINKLQLMCVVEDEKVINHGEVKVDLEC